MCLFQAEGHASQCYPSPTVWIAQGTTVVDLLCVEPGPIVCLIGRIRRPTQGTGRGSSCGALVGIPIPSVIRRDSEWPTERERLGYVCNPRSLKEGTETSRPVATVAVPPLSCRVTGSAPQRKHELMRCTCCLLCSRCDQRQLDAIIACQCPLVRLVTLEVDRSLWQDPNFVSHPTWRLRSLLQGTRVTYVTETFHCWITFSGFWATFGVSRVSAGSGLKCREDAGQIWATSINKNNFTGRGPHLGQRKLFESVFSVWTSFGPGTQPELGQKWSKVVAQRWARQILLSGDPSPLSNRWCDA